MVTIEIPRVILKAEDRGSDLGVIRGIDELIVRGLLTDASLIIQFTGEREKDLLIAAIDQSPLKRRLGVGILLHANFVTGRPVSSPDSVQSLVDAKGIFKRPSAATLGAWGEYIREINMDDFHRELDAQIELFYRRFNHYPHALDAHNMNLWYPQRAAEITMDTAAQLKIPLTSPKMYTTRTTRGPFYEVFMVNQRLRRGIKAKRIPTAEHIGVSYWNSSPTLNESVKRFLKALGSLKPGASEFFFHPGHPDFTSADPRYERGRVRDFLILTDPKVVRRLTTLTMTSYKELSQENNS